MLKKLLGYLAIVVIVASVIGVFISTLNNGGNNKNIIHDYYIYYFTDYKKALAQLGTKYGLEIQYKVGPDFIDQQGQLPPINGKATQLDDFGIARFSIVLPKVLGQYPNVVIRDNLKYIKLSKTVSFYGVNYGGSAFGNILYLTNMGRDEGFTDFYLSQTFHHEFSSILMKQYKFPAQKWMAANPPDFKYDSDFKDVLSSIQQDRDLKGNEYFYKQGVMSKYSYTTMENDFNLFAQTVFNEPERMKMLINKYPLIKAKYEIFKGFYLSISPKFAKTFDLIG